jgi:hypothetical protein
MNLLFAMGLITLVKIKESAGEVPMGRPGVPVLLLLQEKIASLILLLGTKINSLLCLLIADTVESVKTEELARNNLMDLSDACVRRRFMAMLVNCPQLAIQTLA